MRIKRNKKCTISIRNSVIDVDGSFVNDDEEFSILQNDGNTYINGEKIDIPFSSCQSVVTFNNKLYINGYEKINGKWKKTLKARIICWIL